MIFRVCTTSGSGAWVHRIDFVLQPLDCEPCRFSRSRLLRCRMAAKQLGFRRNRTTPLVIFISPSESDVRPRLRHSSSPKKQRPTRAPLMRFVPLQRFKSGASTLQSAAAEATASHPPKRLPVPHRSAFRPEPRALPARFVPSSSFFTTSTVCSTLDRPEISPGSAHGVSSFRGSPVSRRTRSFPNASSPLAVPCRAACRGVGAHCALAAPPTSGSLSEGRPSPLAPGFPIARARFPHGLSCGTSPRPPPELPPQMDGRSAPSRFRIVNDHQRDEGRVLGRPTAIKPLNRRCDMLVAYDHEATAEFESTSFDKLPGRRRTETDRWTAP